MSSSSRWLTVVALIVAGASATFFIASKRRPQRWPDPVRTATAMGDSTCLSCHTDKASYEGTAHHLTTRFPTRASIVGSFKTGENELHTPNAALHFRMTADSNGFYETAITGTGKDTTTRTERIAYVAGSGRKGQSFLYWAGDQLYQLPVSYWMSIGKWINSPGPAYIDGKANFDRAVAPRCLECHATYMEQIPDLRLVNRYKPGTATLGITCERCHGAGQEHVNNERSVLHAMKQVAIVNPARLSRARKMEACGQCHGGLGQPKVPSFSYVAGQRLDDYLRLADNTDEATVDVHGNQVALLSRSKCFRNSQMTCITCHNVHAPQRDVKVLSGKCMDCHQEQSCGLFKTQGHAIAGKCVDCHMPLQQSNLIVSAIEGKQEQALVRTHWIKVYQDSLRRGKPGS